MSVTTVKIQTNTKTALDEFRDYNETYDQVIKKLVQHAKTKDLKKQLIDAYKNMGNDDLQLLKEWEPASHEL